MLGFAAHHVNPIDQAAVPGVKLLALAEAQAAAEARA